jgi:riboflavin synthase
MFTGIVEELGRLHSIERDGDAARLTVACELVVGDARIGDSISVNGCCLTVTSLPDEGFTADLMAETLRATALGQLSVGAALNLERAMAAHDRFGGHLVQGHVDAVGEVVAREERPGTTFLTIAAPRPVARYLVPKGSVTVDGVSLTVVDVTDDGAFRLGLIPHTLAVTNLEAVAVGDRVNLEVDVIAKYVERLLVGGVSSPYGALEGVMRDGTTGPSEPHATTGPSEAHTTAGPAEPHATTSQHQPRPTAQEHQ